MRRNRCRNRFPAFGRGVIDRLGWWDVEEDNGNLTVGEAGECVGNARGTDRGRHEEIQSRRPEQLRGWNVIHNWVQTNLQLVHSL